MTTYTTDFLLCEPTQKTRVLSFTEQVSNKNKGELTKYKVAKSSVIDTINKPDRTLYDTQTGRYVAINKDKKVAVLYEKSEKATLIHNIQQFIE